MPVKPQPVADRFWAKVQKSDGCWIWTAAKQKHGYGLFTIRFHPARHALAHRKSYELVNGPVPEGMDVLHRCDNRQCVRPDHLFLGTQADNNRDMKAKGRASRGTNHFLASLNESKVRLIRGLHAKGETVKNISGVVGVTPGTVYAVLRGKTWRHVPQQSVA